MRGLLNAIVIFCTLIGLAIAADRARADCVSACQASTYCDSEMNASGECGRRLNDCYINECNKTLYGALAYDAESGAVGWSYDFADQGDAEQKAMSGCSESSSNCKIVYDFWNSCAALAAGDDGSYSIEGGNTEDSAQSRALSSCAQNGGANCEIKVWGCTNN